MSLSSKGQNLSETKFRRRILIQSWNITTSGLTKNKRPPYWNSTLGLNFNLITVDVCHFALGYRFCPNRSILSGDMLYRFSRWRPLRRNFTSGFILGDVAFLQMSLSISKPNFVVITQSTAEIWLLPFSKDKRPPYWNSTSGFDFDLITAVGMSYCTSLRNFIQIGLPWQKNVMSIFKMAEIHLNEFFEKRRMSSYKSSIETIPLNCLVFENIAF